ncbi:small ribosomal subunit biogenesis GTPase RsgA [Marinobacter sp. JSM 1782161]|uniref:small ribosomal subunit biogenesis GTPase RsgA n=1 Tax=Marinobacter sp. JSM 1782161 TaxID=2685906 RepID=UPI001403C605|nr:small ribosomal subunit biogenesis GTPase RsgA [Marinobacter sp. JSM 1782161]
MAKRRLNKQQKWRIEKIQEERAARASRRERDIDRKLQSGELGDEQSGLIIAHFGKQIDVEVLEGEQRGEITRCHVRTNLGPLVTGDRVIWRPGADDLGVIVALQDRDSLLQRPDKFGQLKPVAANIDHIILVIAPEPEPHDNLVDRYLVAAENCDITPVLLLNKTDLLSDDNRSAINALLERYRGLGYQVEQTSVHHAPEEDSTIERLLKDRTSVFVGQSGVGKSSIIRRLLQDNSIRVGDVSESTGKGVHTTTTARLFHLGNGDLIDSPGIREFGLWHMDPEHLEYGFREIRPLIGTCRFRNCRHQAEPGCALLEAEARGDISPERMQSFRRIYTEMENSDWQQPG